MWHQLDYTFKLVFKKYNTETFKWLKQLGNAKIKLLTLILPEAVKSLQLKVYNDLYFWHVLQSWPKRWTIGEKDKTVIFRVST